MNKSSFFPLSPPLYWHEGMLLSPQHFQDQDRRWASHLAFHFQCLSPYHWGIFEIRIDLLALSTGLFRLDRLKAILPDGFILDLMSTPEWDHSVDLTPYKKEKITVFLGLPQHFPGLSPLKGETPRFRIGKGTWVSDDNHPDQIIEITRLSPCVFFHVGDSPPSGATSLPLAQVAYQEETYHLLPYIPPCFFVPEDIQSSVIHIVQRIREKVGYLSEKWQTQIGTPLLSETTNQLRPLVQILPLLEPLLGQKQLSPWQLHQALCQTTAWISTLRLGQIPPLFPPYRHTQLRESFTPLLDWISSTLDSLEHAYTVLVFAKHGRLFTLPVTHEFLSSPLLIGLKVPSGCTEEEMINWMGDALITSDSQFDSLRLRRMTGAPRALLDLTTQQDLLPGRGMIVFSVEPDPQWIRPREPFIIVNPADQVDKRPTEMVLYLKNEKLMASATAQSAS